MDIGLDENFDVALDHRHDLPLVEGREAFEQRVAVRVTIYFHRTIGNINRDNILSLLRVEAKRIARDVDEIDSVVDFRAEYDVEQTGQINVTILYDTGDEFTFSVTE